MSILKNLSQPAHRKGISSLFLLASLSLGLFAFFGACQSQASVFDGATELRQEPDYIRGTLANGLRYSIRENSYPKERMVMYLGFSVGALQEEENQRGLAHFVEHMAFNGSKNFPGNTLIEFAQQNGMEFGAHVNAYTSFEDTVYNFVLPTTDDEVINRGLLILSDWLNDLTISDEEVEKERGVVLTERSRRSGFYERYQELRRSVILEGSRYARPGGIIGLLKVLEEGPPQPLRDFYQKWYNTQNAILVIVGDFNAQVIEERLQQQFAAISMRGERLSSGINRQWENIPIRQAIIGEDQEYPSVFAVQMQDDDAPESEILISIKQKRKPTATTIAQLRDELATQLVNIIVSQRFSDIVKEQSQILYNMIGFSNYSIGNAHIYEFSVTGQEGYLKQGYPILLQAIAQLKQYGILQSEMDLALESMRGNMDFTYTGKDKRENETLALNELYQFLGYGLNVDVGWLFKDPDRLLAGISLEQLNQKIAQVLQGTDISIIAHSKDAAELPGKEELKNAYLQLDQLEVARPEVQELPTSLLQNKPDAGKIVREKRLPKTGYFHWVLSNGIEVYFKPTNSEKDVVYYSAFRAGGTQALGDDYGPSSLMQSLLGSVITASGFAGISPEQYERYMSTLQMYNSWSFGLDQTELNGGAGIGEIEELFAQAYLSFTAPQFSQKLVEQSVVDLRTRYNSMLASPEQYFSYLVAKHRYQDNTHILIPPLEQWPDYQATKLKRAFAELVPSARGFRFIFAGDIAKNKLKKYVEQYIAALPTEKEFSLPVESKPIQFYAEGGIKNFALSPEDKALNVVLWEDYLQPAHFDDEQKYRLSVQAELLTKLFDIRLIKVLREKLGKTYAPQGDVSFYQFPKNRMTISFRYGSAPEDVEKLNATLDNLIAEIQQGQIDQSEFRNSKEQFVKTFEENLQANNFWLSRPQGFLLTDHKDIDEAMSEEKLHQVLESISTEDIADFAKKYILPQRKVRYTMLPKNAQNSRSN